MGDKIVLSRCCHLDDQDKLSRRPWTGCCKRSDMLLWLSTYVSNIYIPLDRRQKREEEKEEKRKVGINYMLAQYGGLGIRSLVVPSLP